MPLSFPAAEWAFVPAVALSNGEAVRFSPDIGRQLGLRFTGELVTIHRPLSEAALRELTQPTPLAETTAALALLRPARVARLAWTGTVVALTAFDRAMVGTDGK